MKDIIEKIIGKNNDNNNMNNNNIYINMIIYI